MRLFTASLRRISRLKLFTLCFVRYTFWTGELRVRAVPELRNGNHEAELEFISGTRPSMQVAWLSSLTHERDEFRHSITSSLTTLSQPSHTWTRERSHHIGKTCSVIHPRRRQTKIFDLAQDWMDINERLPGQPNETAGSHITDPYAVVAESAPAGGESSNLTTASTVPPPPMHHLLR
jgi:hypothetical protein